MKAERIIILVLIVFFGCSKNRIGTEEYPELQSLFFTLENVSNEKSKLIEMDLSRLEIHFESFGWEEESSREYQSVIDSHKAMMDKQVFYDSWKEMLINETGGMDGYGYLMEWDKKLQIEEYKPDNDFTEQELAVSEGERSLIIGLIELTNIQIKVLQDFQESLTNTLAKHIYTTESDILLAKIVDSEHYSFDDPALWVFQQYPVDYYLINDRKIELINDRLRFTTDEWDKLNQENLTIKVPMPRFDTTFVFNINTPN